MNAIDFVVRNSTGVSERGSFSGNNDRVSISADSEISLNLNQSDVRGYSRVGDNLEIVLADGRVVVLDGYFSPAANGTNRFFLSSDGYLNEVTFVEADGGVLYATYGETAEWGKWSPSEELIFMERPTVVAADGAGGFIDGRGDGDVSMLGAGLLAGSGLLGTAGAGAAAVVGAGLLAGAGGGDGGSGGGGSDDDVKIDPTVDNPNDGIVLGGDDLGEEGKVITITGTGEPGSNVVVTIDDKEVTTTTGDDGTWEAVFTGDDFPNDGDHDVDVVVTDLDGTVTELDGPGVSIDTTPPTVELTDGTVSVDDITNAEDHEDGVELAGTGEAGASVDIIIGDDTISTIVDETGDWTVNIDETILPEGEYVIEATIVTTDAAGNSTTTTEQIEVDTVPHPITIANEIIGGDGTVNLTEATDGFAVTGTSTAGATVTVTIDGASHDALVDADGNWSVTFASGEVAEGEYTATVTTTTVDAAGNASSTSADFTIDTIGLVSITDSPIEGDDYVSGSEASDGLTVTGTTQAGSSVVVTIGSVSHNATVGADGSWTVDFSASDLEPGTYETTVSVTSTDAAGNTASATRVINVDTESSVSFSSETVETDGIVNATEMADGVTLTGMTEPGSTVVVTAGSVSQTATVAADGSWSVDFSASDLPAGTYDQTVTAVATDALGNTSSADYTLSIDTEGSVDFSSLPIEGDNVVNTTEAADGVVLSGTTEPGSSVTITAGGFSGAATVSSNGAWTVTIPASDITPGTYDLAVTATATDAAGNVSTANHSVAIDTDAAVSLDTSGAGGDGTVNDVERLSGVELTGTTDPGSSVIVTMNGSSRQATVDASGNWTVTFASGEVPTGETDVPVTAVATDTAGNSSTTTGSVNIDTLVRDFQLTSTPGGADAVVNAEEAAQGIQLTGQVEPGSSVMVQLGNASQAATVAADGSWTAMFAASDIPAGEYTTTLTATATDAAGNVSTVTDTVTVDTDAGLLTISPTPVEADDVVNFVEASDGVVLTGTSTPGAIVEVDLNGVSHSVVTNAAGVWSATFAAGEITPGTYDAPITATTTDAAGNTRTVTDSVHIDTEVLNFAQSTNAIAADNIVNATEAGDGVILTGTTEPGGTVSVTLQGVTKTATVAADGSWTATFVGADITSGEYDADVTVDTTDVAGNTAQLTSTLRIDTDIDVTSDAATSPVTGDGVINAVEANAGITLTGNVDPGSAVVVTVAGVAHAATVAANGSWSVDIPSESIPRGDTTVDAVIDATDVAGNTASITETLTIDTDTPDSPAIASYTRDDHGVRGISTELSDDTLDIGQVQADGSVSDLGFTSFDIAAIGETTFAFDNVVPDGSHLVVTAEDDAGNMSGTYLVLDESTTSVVNMSNGNLGDFQIEAIDLQFAEESELTITEAQLVALSDTTDTLVVHGGSDDMVTIQGARAAGSVTQDGETFKAFDLGDTGTVLIDDDITNIVI